MDQVDRARCWISTSTLGDVGQIQSVCRSHSVWVYHGYRVYCIYWVYTRAYVTIGLWIPNEGRYEPDASTLQSIESFFWSNLAWFVEAITWWHIRIQSWSVFVLDVTYCELLAIWNYKDGRALWQCHRRFNWEIWVIETHSKSKVLTTSVSDRAGVTLAFTDDNLIFKRRFNTVFRLPTKIWLN